MKRSSGGRSRRWEVNNKMAFKYGVRLWTEFLRLKIV